MLCFHQLYTTIYGHSASLEPTGKAIGLDMGLKEFYTDSNGVMVANPRNLRKTETRLKRLQKQASRKQKGSNNRCKACERVGRQQLKIQRQRKDHAVKLARCVILSNDLVAYEDLAIRNLLKPHSKLIPARIIDRLGKFVVFD